MKVLANDTSIQLNGTGQLAQVNRIDNDIEGGLGVDSPIGCNLELSISPQKILPDDLSQLSPQSITRVKNLHDLTGQRFGRLLAIEHVGFRGKPGKQKRTMWKCICDCGNYHTVAASSLKTGVSKSCGCFRREWNVTSKTKHAFRGMARILTEYRRGALSRGYSFEISSSDFSQLVESACHYCGVPPKTRFKNIQAGLRVQVTANGIDRIDSSIGYIKSNVVPCCKTCNLAKNDLSLQDFTSWIDRLISHREQIRGDS